MLDSYNRTIDYLRISVTDRCNLRCVYCIPEDGVELLKHSDIISFEKIAETVKTAVGFGITKVRLTGGEPLVRKGIINLVKLISAIDGITDFSLTTNGILLDEFAEELYYNGIKRINISLDTLDSEKYAQMTRGGNIADVIKGITKAKNVGFNPIKINCVIKQHKNEPDALAVAEFCKQNGLEIRYIHEMNLKTGHFDIVDGGTGGDCSICNRLRLTATGKIKPCLFNDIEFDINKLGIEQAILMAINQKPPCGTINHLNEFNNIGG